MSIKIQKNLLPRIIFKSLSNTTLEKAQKGFYCYHEKIRQDVQATLLTEIFACHKIDAFSKKSH